MTSLALVFKYLISFGYQCFVALRPKNSDSIKSAAAAAAVIMFLVWSHFHKVTRFNNMTDDFPCRIPLIHDYVYNYKNPARVTGCFILFAGSILSFPVRRASATHST